jgi:chaperone required for assembly of F1-ATPase
MKRPWTVSDKKHRPGLKFLAFISHTSKGLAANQRVPLASHAAILVNVVPRGRLKSDKAWALKKANNSCQWQMEDWEFIF